MKIAVLSGKGGAGKTLVAVNLAAVAKKATYIDCDVEEPNGHLFLKPQAIKEQAVYTRLPAFDAEKCNGCKACVQFCRFHALMYVKEKPMLFSEVCHSCGGCLLVCPTGAVSETEKQIGVLQTGKREALSVVTGVLNTGEMTGVPVISEALKAAEALSVIDCPPGSACSVMECVQAADYCLLVAEPTVFGFHNFKMVYELSTLLGKPCGVVVNKEETPYAPLEQFCREKALCILARLPYDKRIAACVAEGQLLTETSEEMHTLFSQLLSRIGGSL